MEIDGLRFRLDGFASARIADSDCLEERNIGEKARDRLRQLISTGAKNITDTMKKEGFERTATNRKRWCPNGGIVGSGGAEPHPKANPAANAGCKGLSKLSCSSKPGCKWIEIKKAADKNGRELKDYCRKS